MIGLKISELRLVDDARWPWLLVIPKVPLAVELIDVSPELRSQIWLEVDHVSEVMRDVFSPYKINMAASDFKDVANSKNPTDNKYQAKIGIGLKRFSDIYLNLDTEDRERVCSYFEELMDIVGLQNSDGQLNDFMYGFDPTQLIKE